MAKIRDESRVYQAHRAGEGCSKNQSDQIRLQHDALSTVEQVRDVLAKNVLKSKFFGIDNDASWIIRKARYIKF